MNRLQTIFPAQVFLNKNVLQLEVQRNIKTLNTHSTGNSRLVKNIRKYPIGHSFINYKVMYKRGGGGPNEQSNHTSHCSRT